jgi:prepilin-type N-terminal cleavage/methylation domain-containing protein
METDQREVSMRIRQNHTQELAANINRRERGFTLMEVLVVVVILQVGILSVASMQISSIRGNSFAGRVTEATTWAGNQLELLRSLPYDDDDLSAGDHEDPNPPGNYTVDWNVIEEDVFNNTKTIAVTAAWTDRGVQRSVSMQQIMAK